LLGENGTGKSTALDAVAVALGIWCVARSTAGWRAIRKGEARLRKIKSGDRVHFESSPDPAIMAEGVIGDKSVTWTRMNKGLSNRTSNEAAKEALKVVEDLIALSRRESVKVTLPILAHYGAGRAWLPQIERIEGFKPKKGKVSRFDAYYYSLEGRIRDRELNDWFLYESLDAFQRGSKREGMKVVEQAVLNCLPGSKALRFDVDRKEIVVVMTKAKGGEIPFYALSDGQRSMLSLVADIARKTVILNPHLGKDSAKKSPGVVLIDELDLHLHPNWQKSVVEDLKRTFPSMQFICTTHSPFIVQSLTAEELIKLDGDVTTEPTRRSLDEVAQFVMGVPNASRGQQHQTMVETARLYLQKVEEAQKASPAKKKSIQKELVTMMAPFTNNPAYTALLERRGLIETK
jgi:predicted ATP-binding protein involved in virulence